MKTYLVGGAVRDMLMGLTPKDKDYVVVGSSEKEMLSLGFTRVGADFPVFLHPLSGDEYALARVERKTADGYGGFTVETEGVTLEQDLGRRDLTINAIALEVDFELCDTFGEAYIDPYKGIDDIHGKILRHVSESFSEDPVRVLRVARFLARFGDEWTVDFKTIGLCSKLIHSDDWISLTPERVWKELEKSLDEKHTSKFFKFLYEVGEDLWFGEVWAGARCPQPVKHHPEGDVLTHTLLCVDQATSALTKFAALCHDFGKYHVWVRNFTLYGHEDAGVPFVKGFCERLKVPLEFKKVAEIVCKYHTKVHNCQELRPITLVRMFEATGAYKQGGDDTLATLLLSCKADAYGRTGFEDSGYPQMAFVWNCYLESRVGEKEFNQDLIEKGVQGIGFRDKIQQNRVRLVKYYKGNVQ